MFYLQGFTILVFVTLSYQLSVTVTQNVTIFWEYSNMSSIYLRGKIYWYKSRVDGKNHYQSLKTKKKRIATALQKKLDKKLSNPVTHSKPDDFAHWVTVYLKWLNESVAASHLRNCKGRLNKFVEYCNCNSVELEGITVETIQGFLDGLTFSPKTIIDYKSTISKFIKYCFNNGLDVDINAARATMTPTKKKSPPRFLTIDQECELIKKAYRLDKELYLKIIVAIRSGMRLSEIIRMRWEHVDFNRNIIIVPKSKNGRPRAIPLHRTLRKRLLKIEKASGFVFSTRNPNVWCRDLREIKTAIFTKNMSAHAVGRGWHLFRHTFASRLVQAGVDIFKVSKWLGHSNVTTTMIYAHLSPNNYDNDINRL